LIKLMDNVQMVHRNKFVKFHQDLLGGQEVMSLWKTLEPGRPIVLTALQSPLLRANCQLS
jgi:hypothetical protein